MKSIASSAIWAIVLGVVPVEAPTPRLSNVITRRSRASASIKRGIPVVEIAAEMLQRHQRRRVSAAGRAVGVVDAVEALSTWVSASA